MNIQELTGLLCRSDIGIRLRRNPELLTVPFPELAPMIGFDQKNPHHRYDLWEHSLRALESIYPEPELRLAMLFHDLGKTACYTEDDDGVGHFHGHAKHSLPMAEQALHRVQMCEDMRRDILHLVRHHDTPLGKTKGAVRRKLAVHGEKNYRRLLAVRKADCIGQGTSRDNLVEIMQSERIFEQLLVCEGVYTAQRLRYDTAHLSEGAKSYLLNYVWDDIARNTPEQLEQALTHPRHNRRVFTVEGMSWLNCAKEVREILRQVEDVLEVMVELDSGRVELLGRDISFETIRRVLKEAGYRAV